MRDAVVIVGTAVLVTALLAMSHAPSGLPEGCVQSHYPRPHIACAEYRIPGPDTMNLVGGDRRGA